jgi:hypothetical protein
VEVDARNQHRVHGAILAFLLRGKEWFAAIPAFLLMRKEWLAEVPAFLLRGKEWLAAIQIPSPSRGGPEREWVSRPPASHARVH